MGTVVKWGGIGGWELWLLGRYRRVGTIVKQRDMRVST